MQNGSAARTWTLSGQSVRFGALVKYTDHSVSGQRLVEAPDADELNGYTVARRLPGAQQPSFESLAVNEIYVGDFIESSEVLEYIRKSCANPPEVFFAEVEDELDEDLIAEGVQSRKEFKFFFRFNDLTDALKFKLQYGHLLDKGVMA